ncbi:unnamed protein product [Miscanthus lutarioriparius]|uniref:Uncharacterized protein n=1 Tax=Miscanthus lutarioriparius TaxID=422564 RepID=A0A811MNA3_9POAL|nr:unnamed protein product [Miscanthus lutarioriparius]
MAVVLNEVYALLSDTAARLAYDQEQGPRSEFAGYTARPLYSSWLGPESVYDRARAIAQSVDDEDRIVDAINTCPVDCISYVIYLFKN